MPDLGDTLTDIERRLSVIERTQVSSASSEWIVADTAIDLMFEPRASSSYGDLATVGPEVTVNVGPSGLLVVSLACYYFEVLPYGGYMSFELSGANTLAASDERAIFGLFALGQAFPSTSIALSGLNPGETTVTAKYRSSNYPTSTGEFMWRQVSALVI
jgi:hypothetical protein